MVAQVESEQQTRQCSGPEEYFCRLIACEGYNASRAYKIAWKVKTTAPENRQQASRVLARPHVQVRLERMRQEAFEASKLPMAERLSLLADTARRKIKDAPTHGDRISSIREYSVLTGERRTDGTQVNIGVDLNLSVVLQSLRGAQLTNEPRDVIEIPAGDSGLMVPARAESSAGSIPVPATIAPAGAVLGPLGRVRHQGGTSPSPAAIASPAQPYVCED